MPDPVDAVAEQFDVGDTSLYPAVEASSVAEPAPGVSSPELAPLTQPQDPITGRFVSRDSINDPPTHPEYLVKDALEMGYSQAEIEMMPTHILGTVVHKSYRDRLTRQSQDATQRTLQASGETVPDSSKTVPENSSSEEEFQPLADDGNYLPELVKMSQVIASLQKEVRELRSLKEQVGGIQNHLVRQQQESLGTWIDRLITEGKDKRFGEGSIKALDKNSPEFSRRQAIVNEAKRLGGEKANPDQWIPMIPKAMSNLFGEAAQPGLPGRDVEPTNGAAKPKVSPQEWAQAGLGHPTARVGSPEPKGEELAKRNAARKFREMGVSVQDDSAQDQEIDDTLNG